MTNEQKLKKLISFLEGNDIGVKSDRGNFKGGLVRYHDEKSLYLNRRLDTEARLKLIINEIKQLKISDSYDEEIQRILNDADE